VCFFRRCTWPRPTATASLGVRRAWYCAWPCCVCVSRCLCMRTSGCLSFCAAVCGQPLSAAMGGTGPPVCACARACACVPDSLLSLGMGVGPSLPLSLPHTLIHAVCGRAGGGIEGQLGRLKQQRVHCVGEEGPLGAARMRRLRHAWGGHSERERGARAAASGGVPCVSAMATKFNSARQICRTKLQNNGTELQYGPPLPPSRLWGECGLSVGEYVCLCMCV
jgi:hypothetical protein